MLVVQKDLSSWDFNRRDSVQVNVVRVNNNNQAWMAVGLDWNFGRVNFGHLGDLPIHLLYLWSWLSCPMGGQMCLYLSCCLRTPLSKSTPISQFQHQKIEKVVVRFIFSHCIALHQCHCTILVFGIMSQRFIIFSWNFPLFQSFRARASIDRQMCRHLFFIST